VGGSAIFFCELLEEREKAMGLIFPISLSGRNIENRRIEFIVIEIVDYTKYDARTSVKVDRGKGECRRLGGRWWNSFDGTNLSCGKTPR